MLATTPLSSCCLDCLRPSLAALRACGAVIVFLPLFWRGGLPRLSPALLLRAAAEGAATILLLLSLSMTSLSLVTRNCNSYH